MARLPGERGKHFILRPGDSYEVPTLVAVPSDDHVLRVLIETTYERYPIRPRIDVRLARSGDGSVTLAGNYVLMEFESYAGV
jgi:hypothetical protein